MNRTEFSLNKVALVRNAGGNWQVKLMRRTALSVNLNKVALVRNSREGNWPDPVFFGRICLEAGAAGLTVHPRPDERHIRASDVPRIAGLVAEWPGREFNIEGNPFHNLMGHLRDARPHQATFVPDAEGQKTSDHGFDLSDASVCRAVEPLIAEAKALGCRVSLFMDPVPELMARARELGADRVELYTEAWAKAYGCEGGEAVLKTYAEAAQAAVEAGLGVNAGHDLSLGNLEAFLSACRSIDEVSIGHALTCEALQMGFAETVRRYNEILDRTVQDRDL